MPTAHSRYAARLAALPHDALLALAALGCEQNAAVLWRLGRSERSRQTAIGLGEVRTFGLNLQIWRHDDFWTRSNCYGSCRIVVWSTF